MGFWMAGGGVGLFDGDLKGDFSVFFDGRFGGTKICVG